MQNIHTKHWFSLSVLQRFVLHICYKDMFICFNLNNICIYIIYNIYKYTYTYIGEMVLHKGITGVSFYQILKHISVNDIKNSN